jgi:hypothetical protein
MNKREGEKQRGTDTKEISNKREKRDREGRDKK